MRALITFVLTVTAGIILAQNTINYKISYDEPRKINNFSCNIDLAQMDAGFGAIDGISFNTGVWGHLMFKQRLGIDYTFRYGWLTFGRFAWKDAKKHINAQGGGFFIFHQNKGQRSNKVILKQTTSNQGSKRVTTTEYINVPSQKWRYQALRAGLYFNRGLVGIENPDGKDNFANYYILGAYGGICFGSSRNLIVQTDKYGEKGVVSHLRVCFDALITPANNVPSTVVKNAIPIGGRILVQALPTLTRKNRHNKKYSTKFTAEVEAGYRMVDGIYVAGTMSIPISRSFKALACDEESMDVKRTTE